MTTNQNPTIAVLITTVARVWEDIRATHGDVPPVVVTVGSGTVRQQRGLVTFGHFAACRWVHDAPDGAPEHELFLAGEGLRYGGREVLTTLLHEAAHGMAYTRKVKDTSRDGRYHNKRFVALATELGLAQDPEPHKVRGYSSGVITVKAAGEHADLIRSLDNAIGQYRLAEDEMLPVASSGSEDGSEDGAETERPAKRKGTVAVVCECGRRVRVTPSVLDLGPITCGVCNAPFLAEE